MPHYDAFISYSHAKDKPIAAALQGAIQKLGKPWYRRRALRVFRDDTSLSATPHLWPTIQRALEQSRYLILLASPEAAASPWVDKEVHFWLANKSADTLLIAVTGGALGWDAAASDFRAGAPLPPALKGRLPGEPKWIELAAWRDGSSLRDARFTELAADFAAAIRGMPKEDLLSQEVRQQRRALRLAWSAASVLLLLAAGATGAGVLAYRAQQAARSAEQRAVAERDSATKSFRLAQGTAEGLVFNIARGLRDAQGMRAETVRKILETAAGTFDLLTAAAPDDFDLQHSRAVMLSEFGDTYVTLGELAQALKSHRDSLAIIERLVKTAPDNARLQHDLAVAYLKIGDVLAAQGNLGEAQTSFRAGRAIMERRAQADPGDTQAQRDLSVFDNKLGDALVDQGELDAALKSYRASLAIRERLVAGDPNNALWQRDLAVCHGEIGDVLVAQGSLADALSSYRAGLAIHQRLAQAAPDNTESQRDLSVSDLKIADALMAQGDLAGALESYRASFAIMTRLAAADPGNAQWQRELSVAYEKIGNALMDQGSLDEALNAYRADLAIMERLAAADPGNAQWQHDLSVAYEKVGNALVDQGSLDEALNAYRADRAIMERLTQADPRNAQWERALSVSYDAIGDVLLNRGDGAQALKSYRASLAIRQRLTRADPDNAEWQRDLWISYNKSGNALVAQGDLDAALTSYRDSAVIAGRLARADPGNAQSQKELRSLAGNIGALAYRFVLARDFPGALEAADQAISLTPDALWLHMNRAHALMFLGRLDEARALYLRHRGAPNVQDDNPWETVVLEDFAELRKAGLTHPLMHEIEHAFAGRG